MKLAAPYVASDWTIGLVVGGLIVWAAYSAWRLFQGTRKVARALDRAAARLTTARDASAFATQFEAVSADLTGEDVLGERWRKFEPSLVRVKAPRPHVRSTSRCEQWFNLGLLPANGVDLRYHAALPNLLVGAGLLFTFLGLAAALTSAGGVMEGDPHARNVALKGLLDTASAKFITSLCGLLLSIAYALFRKRRLVRVEEALDRFAIALDHRAPLLTPLETQRDQIDILERQLTSSEALATEMSFAVAQALDQAFDKRLGEHIQPLTAAMTTLADRFSKGNEDAIRDMLEAFLRKLEGGTGDHMHKVADSLTGLSERLDGLQAGLGESTTRMALAAETMARTMGEGAEAALAGVTEQMNGLVDTLRRLVDATHKSGEDASRSIAEKLTSSAADLDAAAQKLALSLSESAARADTDARRRAEETAASLTAQLDRMVAQLTDLSERQRETASGAMLEAARRIEESTNAMREAMTTILARFGDAGEHINRSVADGGATFANGVGTAVTGLQAALERTSEGLAAAGKSAGEALREGGSTAGERMTQSGATVADRAAALGDRVTHLAAASENMAARLAAFEKSVESAAAPLAASAAQFVQAGDTARAALAPLAQTAQSLGQVSDQIAGVGQRIEATQQAAGDLARSLNGASERFKGVDVELSKVVNQISLGLEGFRKEVARTVEQTDKNLGSAVGQLGNAIKDLEFALEPIGDLRAAEASAGRRAPAGRL